MLAELMWGWRFEAWLAPWPTGYVICLISTVLA